MDIAQAPRGEVRKAKAKMELKLVRDVKAIGASDGPHGPHHLGGGTLTRLSVAWSWGQWVTPGALSGLERRLVAPQAAQRGQAPIPSLEILKSPRDVVLGSLL